MRSDFNFNFCPAELTAAVIESDTGECLIFQWSQYVCVVSLHSYSNEIA